MPQQRQPYPRPSAVAWLGGAASRVAARDLVASGISVIRFDDAVRCLDTAGACRRDVMILVPPFGDAVPATVRGLVTRARRGVKVLALVPDRYHLIGALRAGAADAYGHEIESAELASRVSVWLERAAREREQRRALMAMRNERAVLRAAIRDLEEENDVLRDATAVDPVTGLADSIGFRDRAHRALALCARLAGAAAMVVIWLEEEIGVADLAFALEDSSRVTDVAGRLRSDELALLLPATDLLRAGRAAERLRERLPAVSASYGVSGIARVEPDLRRVTDRLLSQARAAARWAREAGTNRITLFPELGHRAA